MGEGIQCVMSGLCHMPKCLGREIIGHTPMSRQSNGKRCWVPHHPRRVVCCLVVGAGLLVPPSDCNAAEVVDDEKAFSRAELFLAPTVEWLPEPQETIPEAYAEDESAMGSYTETIPGNQLTFDMVPIRGGSFMMGSPADEPHRRADEGPRHQVKVEPFWMGKCEVTWNEFALFEGQIDREHRKQKSGEATPQDQVADALTAPSTVMYSDLTFGMGHDGCPVVCMTQLAAKLYCRWLSAKTGRYYRLPTEAEWEYACRAGTDTAYSFGDSPDELDRYAWHYRNSGDSYHRVGQKEPNPWGLHDMHGNVAEWVLDQYVADFYGQAAASTDSPSPMAVCRTLYPRVVRGGSWDDDPDGLRSAARRGSSKDWSMQDPQDPQSYFWHTESITVGFRVVRPYRIPSAEECERLERIKRDLELDRHFKQSYELHIKNRPDR